MLVRSLQASNPRRSNADTETSFRQNWTGEKELKLFGLDDLVKKDNQWHIDIKDYLLASYNHYEKVGLGGNTMLPTVEELLEDKLSSTSGSFLPVCDSYMPVQAPSTNHLPCMCGDENGSETLAFWKETNFQSWVAAHKNGHDEPHYLCMYDMGKYRVPPVPYFLNMCSLDYRWVRNSSRYSSPPPPQKPLPCES